MSIEREINTHAGNLLNDKIKVTAHGEPGPCGACLRYRICVPMLNPVEQYPVENARLVQTYTDIRFQSGNPVEQINGISNEALLAVVRDRLEGFQRGPFACDKNAHALVSVIGAMSALSDRSNDRIVRGVEGRTEK